MRKYTKIIAISALTVNLISLALVLFVFALGAFGSTQSESFRNNQQTAIIFWMTIFCLFPLIILQFVNILNVINFFLALKNKNVSTNLEKISYVVSLIGGLLLICCGGFFAMVFAANS